MEDSERCNPTALRRSAWTAYLSQQGLARLCSGCERVSRLSWLALSCVFKLHSARSEFPSGLESKRGKSIGRVQVLDPCASEIRRDIPWLLHPRE